MFGTSLAFWSPPQDEAAPLEVLSSGVCGTLANGAGGGGDAIADSITVPANTTALVVIFGGKSATLSGTEYGSVAFNGDPMDEILAVDATSSNTMPGLAIWVLKDPDIGTFNLTATPNQAFTANFRGFVCIGGDVHDDVVVSGDFSNEFATNNDRDRTQTVNVTNDGSILISGIVEQGADTDPFAHGSDLDATLQTGDSGGVSTTADIGFGFGWGAVDSGTATYSWTPTAGDGGTHGAIVVSPPA